MILSKAIRAGLLTAGLAVVLGVMLPQVAQAQFNLKDGIVGNLPAACRDSGKCDFCDFIALFVVLQKVILSLFGGLAIVMFIWGGQGLIMAAGNQEKIAASKKLLTSTIFGVLIILGAYFLVAIIVNILTSPTSTGGSRPALVGTQDWWKGFCQDKVQEGAGESDSCLTKNVGDPCGDDPATYACADTNPRQCLQTCAALGTTLYICRDRSGPNSCAVTQQSNNYCAGGQVCCRR